MFYNAMDTRKLITDFTFETCQYQRLLDLVDFGAELRLFLLTQIMRIAQLHAYHSMYKLVIASL